MRGDVFVVDWEREPEPARTCGPPSVPSARSPAAKVGRSAVLEVLDAPCCGPARPLSFARPLVSQQSSTGPKRHTVGPAAFSPGCG